MRGFNETPGRTIGVGALYGEDGKYVEKSACFLRLHRQFDRTGVFEFKKLDPDTSYRVRVGSLTLTDSDSFASDVDSDVYSRLPVPESFIPELEKLQSLKSLASFTTYSETSEQGLGFIFGSCRYPGLLWQARQSDKIFGSIREQLDQPNPPKFVLMNGDQIYADKLGRNIPFLRADTPSEFSERYQTAFTSPHMRDLLRSVPTYMILDDHDIEDDWTANRMNGDHRKYIFYQNAIAAYKNYQWIFSPRNYCPRSRPSDVVGYRYFYSFECSGYPFFVMDSRTQRIQKKEAGCLENNHLLGYPFTSTSSGSRAQIDILCDWLVFQQKTYGNLPKFIVSPSMFAPNNIDTAGNDGQALDYKCADDSWASFPVTRRQILKTIVDSEIQNVVFLCGDAHSSCVAEIHFMHQTQGKLPLRAFVITSSAFYWPWPFSSGRPDSFVHDSEKQNDGFDVNGEVVMHYTAHSFVQENNYTRVDIGGGVIRVQNYNRNGTALGTPSVLVLAGKKDN